MKNELKSRSIALGLALLLTTLCYGQGYPQGSYYGPPHNVIYWNGDTSNNQLQTLVSSDYTDVIVNFVSPDTNCNVSGLGGDIASSIQTLHNAGKTVLVSFGGQEIYDNSNNDLTSEGYQACYADILAGGSKLVQQLASIVTNNGFDGVDIDFEDSSAFQSQKKYDGVDYLTKLTNNIYSALPQWHNIITHAPQTGYWISSTYNYAYVNIVLNTNGNIAWFNDQTYNNCPSTDCSASDKIASYKAILAWVPPTKLVMGVPVSPNAAGSGYIPFSSQNGNDVQSVISQLQQAYPNAWGGVMGWNYLQDINDDNGSWSGEVLSALNSSQTPWVGYNSQTGLCLESNDQGYVDTNYCSGGNYQNWQFFVNTIRDAQTNFCLDSNDQGNVYADSCNGGNYQNWQFWGNAIRNRQTGLCLDTSNVNDPTVPNGGVVYADSCNGSATQNWWYPHAVSWPNPVNPNE